MSVYNNIYQAASLDSNNRATISIGLCEKALSTLYLAKDAKDNKEVFLGYMNEIIGILGSLSSTLEADLGLWGKQMQCFYVDVSIKIAFIMSNQLDVSQLEDVIDGLKEARDIWRDVYRKYLEEEKDKNSTPADSEFI